MLLLALAFSCLLIAATQLEFKFKMGSTLLLAFVCLGVYCTTKCGTHFELELKLAHVTFTCFLLPFLVFLAFLENLGRNLAGAACLFACFCMLVLAFAC